MKEFVEILPPNYHRYPLPAHDTGAHNLATCGDPEWCLHDIPTAAADSKIEYTPVPIASKPAVLFSKNAEKYRNRIVVDTAMISEELTRSGFDEKVAQAFSLVIHDRDETSSLPIDGWYNSTGFLEGANISRDSDSLEIRPVAIHVVYTGNMKKMSHSAWHEFGHAHQQKVKKTKLEPAYNLTEPVHILRHLWLNDPEEMYAENFANKRDKLRPIKRNLRFWQYGLQSL